MSIENRREPRAWLSPLVQVRFHDLDEFLAMHAANLSAGGMFIATREPREVGALLYLQFYLEDGETLIEGMGKVVWRRSTGEARSDAPAGMGIAFISLDKRSEELIRRVVREHLGEGS
jgi:uncharacterized protein (TIGR02266 family)